MNKQKSSAGVPMRRGENSLSSNVFSRLLDDFFSRGLSTLGPQASYFPIELNESDNGYEISVDMPGVSKKDVKIEIRGNSLVVSGERKKGGDHRSSYGSFYRSFMLPTDADLEKIQADYSDGVLQITVSKTEATPSRMIPIGDRKSDDREGRSEEAA